MYEIHKPWETHLNKLTPPALGSNSSATFPTVSGLPLSRLPPQQPKYCNFLRRGLCLGTGMTKMMTPWAREGFVSPSCVQGSVLPSTYLELIVIM